jgi:hypothetical protein
MPDPDEMATDHLAADARLKALFAGDEPPARDPLFSAAVMEEIVRRRFIEDVAGLIGVTTIGGMILWLLWPSLTPVVASLSQGLAPLAACLTLAAIVVALAGVRPGAALGFEHD